MEGDPDNMPLLAFNAKDEIDGVEQLEGVLGRGAYGVVFEGKWRGIKVAIKRHYYALVHDETGQLSSPYRSFLGEFRMLREFPHPNIVQVFGMVPQTMRQDTPGLVMEYLQKTLRKRYAESPRLTALEESTVALGVASALGYLHGRQVIHRDLTTNNIMISEVDGELRVKITDIGGAAVMNNGAREQSMTVNPGAQTYMAPETQRPGADGLAIYGAPADCYSYAVSTLAMCIRREPPSVFTLAVDGRVGDLETLSETHALRGIIVRCLETDPERRPTAADLCRDVAGIQSQLRCSVAHPPDPVGVSSSNLVEKLRNERDDQRRRCEQLQAEMSRSAETLLRLNKLQSECEDIRSQRDKAGAEVSRLVRQGQVSLAKERKLEQALDEEQNVRRLEQEQASVELVKALCKIASLEQDLVNRRPGM